MRFKVNENHKLYKNKNDYIILIKKFCEKNKNILELIRKKIYPISIHSSPDIYNEMYLYWISNGATLPLERLENSSNKYLYIKRFKNLAYNKYYVENNKLYYIKKLGCERNEDGTLLDKSKCILKKIPYIFEVYNIINELHTENFHEPKDKLIKFKTNLNYYLDSFDFLIDYIMKRCPICVSKYFSKKIIPNIKIIKDIGPHYRYLMDITYLKSDIDL